MDEVVYQVQNMQFEGETCRFVLYTEIFKILMLYV